MWSLLFDLVAVGFLHFASAGPADRPYGTFQEPAARVRPEFRYWLPDASVDPDILAKDISSAGDIGIGGVELLPFYNYGGGTPINDWSLFGFGTPAFNVLFAAALEVHRDNDMVMDFAIGPNQGQGVPAEPDNRGLQWDLITASLSVPPDGLFNGTIPGWGTGELVSVVSAQALSETNATIPPRGGSGLPTNYTRVLLKDGTLTELTDQVTENGTLTHQFPPVGQDLSYRLYAFYQDLTHAKNLDPQKNVTTTIFDYGCFIVDHFDPKGAAVMIDFWDEYILSNSTKQLLTQVGNSGWEDSMELLSNVSWSPSLTSRFYDRLGYRLEKYLPLIVFGNNNINLQSSQPGALQSVLDTADQGSGYINDYRIVLAEGYQEFLKVLTNWTRSSLDLQYSSQTSYNLPMAMEASIPYDDIPECESLQFRDNVDSYRQFSGVAYLAGKNVVSIELGAVFGDAFIFTIPDLLFAMNRAASGRVNQYIIHGQAYTGNYTETTWPGYVSFGYRVSDQYSEKRPDWHNGLAEGLEYMARTSYVQQAGTGRIDVAFYNRQSATDPIVHTLYTPNDLQSEGWTYAYLSPDNFNLTQATVRDGVLAPGGPAFQALVVESTQNLTLEGAAHLIDYASSGLPIVISGGSPGVYASGDLNDQPAVEAATGRLLNTMNVYSVEQGQVAAQLRSLRLSPRIGVRTNSTLLTTWREDNVNATGYAYLFSDTNATSGDIIVRSTKKPYHMNLWTGEIKPVVVYNVQDNTTTIPVKLAGNQTVIIAFSDQAFDHCEPAPDVHITDLTFEIIGCEYGTDHGISLHLPLGSSGIATLSSGEQVSISGADVPSAIPLIQWNLTAEHWAAPENINDASVIARKFNTTHQLNSLQSWLDIPELVNVSGIGYYTTTFTWLPEASQHGTCHGAYISFSKILNAIRVYVNGQRVPPLDYNNAAADISSYLRSGSNEVLAVVPTTMWNYLQTILPQIRNAGVTPSFPGGPFVTASPLTDNGLVGTASIVPFKKVTMPMS